MSEKNYGRFPPWSRIESLSEITAAAGVNMEQFLHYLELGRSNTEIAQLLGVSEPTVQSLTEHFYKYGIGSTMGGD